MKAIATVVLALFLAFPVHAQTKPSVQTKLDELVRIIDDPDVQSFLMSRGARTAEPDKIAARDAGIATWEAGLRDHINSVLAAVPRIPSEVADAAARTRSDATSRGYAPVFLIFAALIAIGLAAEWAYRSLRQRAEGAFAALTPIAIFAGAMSIIFFAVDWPPLARVVLLAYLVGFVCFRLAVVAIDLTAEYRSRRRAKLFCGMALFAVTTSLLGPSVGVDRAVTHAISYVFSVILLLLAIEAVWSVLDRRAAVKATLTGVLVTVWIFWCLDFTTLFWLSVYALILPGLLRGAGRIAAASSKGSSSEMREVFVVRAARALVVAAAVGWLALVWRMNPDGIGHRDPTVTAIFYGLLKSVVILLLADLVWQLMRKWIDNKLSESDQAAALPPAEVARRQRFRTLLPIFRNGLAVVVIVMTVLIVLGQLGVEIAPLIAGAGIFGVALGFGSQTLVKDVISGVFYMFDDAFRVGEYIQAKNYKGTVEGFSLRSVRLRHHRGPVFTIPFGELGAVQNMSRDWGVMKFRISVGYGTDLEKARKLTKKIGTTLLEDPELGPIFLEPLKMKGLEEFGDYGLVLSFGMMLKPSPMQSFIRRRANLMLREAFTENGIEFATPSVQVGRADAGGQEAAAAASAIRVAQQANAAASHDA